MGNREKKSKIVKSLSVIALSSSFVLASLGHAADVTKATTVTNVDNLLAKLTPAQRQALQQLSTNEANGLQVSPETDLDSNQKTSVIVEFENDPAKIAELKASLEGQQLTESDASDLVDQDHTTFQEDLPGLLTDENKNTVDYKIQRSFKTAFNGVSITLPANQIKNLLKSKAVKAVYSNETFTIEPPALDVNKPTKADEFNVANYTPYDQLDRLHKEGITGKGIKIGILDTGMDYNHPDLKDAYKGGYDFVDNDNNPMETTYADWVKAGKPGKLNGADYYTEHGTHVAGIIGGRGVANSEYKTLGAAPDADLYAYRVLGPGGSGASDGIIAALDRAVKDGMDVVNMSLGNTLNDPLYATSIAVNNTVLSGVTAVVAAGNSGDQMFTLGSPGTAALALTVGASSVAIDIYQYKGTQNGKQYTLRELGKNYADDLSTLKGKTLSLVDVGIGNPADYTGKNVSGKIAFIQRGDIALVDKVKNARAAGAAGVLMYNNDANKAEGPIQAFLGESMDQIPAFSISNEDSLAISAAMKQGQTDFTFGDFSKIQTAGDELAAFSSRGPSRLNYDIKPEVTAPGVSILSTVPAYFNDQTLDGSKPDDYKYAYARLSGTSMATPYVAGVSALLLQTNKDLQPADIKSILMNTADPLSKAYSVFEEGSGRVDAYEAIHSNVELQVVDKTPTIINGEEKNINELTGGMSFGSFGFDDKDISDSRSVTLKNRSEKAKTFSVNVKYQTGLRGSLDAAQNNVTLTGPTSIKLNGISSKSVKFSLNIPKTAAKGTYEGFVVFTNNADPTEQYQIPFGVRVVNEGIDTFKALNPTFSTRFVKPSSLWAHPFIDGQIAVKSYMQSLDVVIQDPTTGEDIGYLGSIGNSLNENTVYTVNQLFTGTYYPFTDDPKNPISMNAVPAKPGHYKLRLVGTSESGKTFSAAQDILYEIAPPTVTSNFDALDQKVIEYNDSQLDSSGKFLYNFKIHVDDPETDDAQRYDIPVDKSNNSVVTFWNSAFGSNPIRTDKNGDYTDKVVVDSSIKYLNFSFYGMDSALNGTDPTSVVFVKDTTPYYYLKTSTKVLKTGDSMNYTVRANNIKNLKTTKLTISAPNKDGVIENVKVNDAVKQYGDATVTLDKTASGTANTNYTMTFTYNGTTPLPEDLSLFNFDLHSVSKTFLNTVPVGSFTISSTDQFNVVTNNMFIYIDRFVYQNKFSSLAGGIGIEGALDPITGKTIPTIDQRTIGAKVTVTSYDGNTVVNAPITTKSGSYLADGLPVDTHPYEVKVEAPGYFTTKGTVDVTDNLRGELVGKAAQYLVPIAAAGDTNNDDVIDILDVLNVQAFWGTNKATADFNFDHVVDAKDMNYVVNNFGLQNPSATNPPKVKKSYKGATLDRILAQLGMK
ncbi:S8 family serine peptidase [Gottfriedia sp. NPDC057991]|uniref:S8 family serine peptidase n=1 Tax=Gottfriedia sp. NPDC057991 TaxID=3346298 RepID=UPI0036D7F732